MDIAVKLRAFREYYRASRAQLRERRRREYSPLHKWLGADKPRTMTSLVLYIHALIASGLFTAPIYWLSKEFVNHGKAVPHSAILLPFVLPAIYLSVVHFVIRKNRRGEK